MWITDIYVRVHCTIQNVNDYFFNNNNKKGCNGSQKEMADFCDVGIPRRLGNDDVVNDVDDAVCSDDIPHNQLVVADKHLTKQEIQIKFF